MSDATLNDVIARLDRLEAALSKIADAIKAAGESRAAARPCHPRGPLCARSLLIDQEGI